MFAFLFDIAVVMTRRSVSLLVGIGGSVLTISTPGGQGGFRQLLAFLVDRVAFVEQGGRGDEAAEQRRRPHHTGRCASRSDHGYGADHRRQTECWGRERHEVENSASPPISRGSASVRLIAQVEGDEL